MTNSTSKEIDLTIPEFLRSENRPPPPKMNLHGERRWVTPDSMKKVRARAEQRTQDAAVDDLVFEAIQKGADTGQKINKELAHLLDKEATKKAVKRLLRDRRIRKEGRRYYAR